MSTAVDHLKAALAEVTRERDVLDQQIAVLEQSIADLTRLNGAGFPSSDLSAKRFHRTVREIVLATAAASELIEINDVIAAARAEGSTAQYASVSSVMSRLYRDGLLEKGPRRGTYRSVSQAPEPAAESSGNPFGTELSEESQDETDEDFDRRGAPANSYKFADDD